MFLPRDHVGVVRYDQSAVGNNSGSTGIGSPPAPRAGLLVISSRMPLSKLRARFYYPELDSIRFFLFCGVWVYHALPREEGPYSAHHVPMPLAVGITSIIKASMCSLDVFFIISAFLITGLLLREKELKGGVGLKAFYTRRLLRIWPLYFFVIGLAGLLSVIDRTQVLGWACTLCYLLFAGNWVFALGDFPPAQIIWPLWSVSFEEQFYLLWPLVLRWASKRIIYGAAIGLLVVGSFARLILLLEHTGQRMWFNSFVRVDSIAYGILLAVSFHGRDAPRFRLPTRVVLLLLGGTAWVIVGQFCRVLDPEATPIGVMIGYPLMSLGGVAIFLSVFGAVQDGAPFLKNSGLVYLGNITYGLYAYHYLGLRLSGYAFVTRHHDLRTGAFYLFCALAITFLLAAASFKWLETPFLRLKQRFTYVPSGARM
jgi:peptidoglycan/LPS O-acetylase OafA/YrhL